MGTDCNVATRVCNEICLILQNCGYAVVQSLPHCTEVQNGQFSSSGDVARHLKRQPCDIQDQGCPIFEFKDNLPFVSLFSLVFYYDGLKPHKVHRNIDFPFKMVRFCTKTPNFKSEYLKNAQIIAKILKVLTKFIKTSLQKCQYFA